MKPKNLLLFFSAILLILAAPRSGLSIGPWTNGQAANLVLGHPDFTTGNDYLGIGADEMYNPEAVAVDPATGKVFVADSGNHRVLCFASGTALMNGAAAEAVLGQPDFISKNNNTVNAASMSSPQAVAVDTAGRLWVADSGHDRVLRFDNAAAKTNGANADGVLGQSDFTSGLPGISIRRMNGPEGLAIDASGRLWVADTWSHRILRFDNAAAKANGANADAVLGQANFIDYDFATARNRMYLPQGMVVNAAGALFIADSSNHRVLRFDNAAAKADGADADGVLGQLYFTSKVLGSRVRNGMYYPAGVSLDSEGQLYVADSGNDRILIFNNAAAKANGVDADNVLGQPDFTTNVAKTSASGLYSPVGVFADNAAGALWVADRNHARVLRYSGGAVSDYLLTVQKSGAGTVMSSPAGISCGLSCGFSFNPGESVTLTATPASGSTFAGWGGACVGTGQCVVTMDAAKSVSATFHTTFKPSIIQAVHQLLLKK